MLKPSLRYQVFRPIFLLFLAGAPLAPGAGAWAAETAAAKESSGDTSTAPPGVDISKLDDFERKIFFRVVNREASACGKGHSLLYSAKHDPACRKSFYAVRYVGRMVDSGYTDSEIAEKLEKRFRAPRHTAFDLSAAPVKGNPSARVTLVEFVDYECPHCKHAQSLLRQTLEAYPSDVRLFFKHYPLGSHSNARLAAEATLAAHKQGKFWAYNDKVWAIAEILTPAILEKIAKEVGLDLTRYRLEKDTDEIRNRVQKDKSEAVALGITGTPAIFINGRKYTDPLELTSMRDWIDEELGR